jgi:hypothetical protein
LCRRRSRTVAAIDLIPDLLPVAISEVGLKAATHRLNRAESKGLPASSAIFQHPEKPLVHQFLEGRLIPAAREKGALSEHEYEEQRLAILSHEPGGRYEAIATDQQAMKTLPLAARGHRDRSAVF